MIAKLFDSIDKITTSWKLAKTSTKAKKNGQNAAKVIDMFHNFLGLARETRLKPFSVCAREDYYFISLTYFILKEIATYYISKNVDDIRFITELSASHLFIQRIDIESSILYQHPEIQDQIKHGELDAKRIFSNHIISKADAWRPVCDYISSHYYL